jgi:hypothetical protein
VYLVLKYVVYKTTKMELKDQIIQEYKTSVATPKS